LTSSRIDLHEGVGEVLLRNRARAELERSQWLSLEDLELLQIRRMRALVKHAYETVPFYHRVFDESKVKPEDIHSRHDLLKIPILTKEVVRSHTYEMISSIYDIKNLEEKSTSGSTSIPLKVYRCREQNAYSAAVKLRNNSWVNMTDRDYAAVIAPGGEGWRSLKGVNDLRLDSYEISVQKLERLAVSVRRLRPKFLVGFPSGQILFSRFCEERGIDDISFEWIRCSGEKIFEEEKRRMERIFSSKVHEHYSATESSSIGSECAERSGLHISSENQFVEFIKDDELAAPGEMASVIVTPLFSYGMPLIRYELGDVAYHKDDVCPCSRGLPLMSYVDGRITDILVAPDGRLLCNSNFHSRIFAGIDIQQYRIIQEKVTSIVIELVPGKNYTEKATDFIVKSIKRYMGQEVDVTVKLKDKIEPGSSAKRRIVVSHVPVKL